MQKLYIFILTILFFNSCQSDDKEQVVKIENKYSISIPSFMTKDRNLNKNATLQYRHQNALKEFYVIVIDESKEEVQKALSEHNLTLIYSNDIKGYTNLILSDFEQHIKILEKSELIDTLVNNMSAKLLTLSARAEDIEAFYALAFIEGKKRYYQITIWTLASKKHEFEEKMNQILYSLKEL